MSTICVVGLGYIGLPVASMLASRGHNVVGYDVNSKAVDSVNKGQAHFFEPDLDMLLKAAVNTERLKASTMPVEADYYVIAVPTPFSANHQPDLSYVDAATQSIAPFLKTGSTVVLESTSPVGTTERIAEQLAAARTDLRFPA
jgi:UDP-N-acetyl-D-mannosaminuronic acid dehydrogenase